jgi:hypothetical protein
MPRHFLLEAMPLASADKEVLSLVKSYFQQQHVDVDADAASVGSQKQIRFL